MENPFLELTGAESIPKANTQVLSRDGRTYGKYSQVLYSKYGVIGGILVFSEDGWVVPIAMDWYPKIKSIWAFFSLTVQWKYFKS